VKDLLANPCREIVVLKYSRETLITVEAKSLNTATGGLFRGFAL
jgi:hypothetical protein